MTALDILSVASLLLIWGAVVLLHALWHTTWGRILRSLPLWLGYSLVALVLDIIGLVIMLPLAGFRLWRVRGSKVYRAPMVRKVTAWRGGWLTWLWGNEEDGVTGPTWWEQRTGVYLWPEDVPKWRQCLKMAWSAYRWSALRNPSNNMRFIPGINPVIRPEAVRSWEWLASWAGPSLDVRLPRLDYAVLTWQGMYSGIRCHIAFRGEIYRFWWGWKLKPTDASGVPPDDMRAPRCGFATQFKRIG